MAKRPLAPLVALAVVLGAMPARADDPAARARGILADPSYQGERPGAPPALPCSGLPGGCTGDKKGAQPGGTSAGDAPGKSSAGSTGSGDARRGEGRSGQEKPGESSGGRQGGERDGEPSGKSGSGRTGSGDQQKTGESSGGRQGGERDEQPSRRPSDVPPPPREAPSRSAAGEVIGTLLLAVVGAGVVVLLVFGIAVALKRRQRAEPETMVAAVASAPAAPPEMSDAEKLARDGRYADAVHLLLQSALAHVATRGGLSIDEAMTSREVLADATLDDASRWALRELVVSVELSLFGGADITQEGYARCLESYRRIAPAGGA